METWQYRKKNRTLGLTCYPYYQIDLNRCNTSAQVLDWIIQVSKKTWAARETIGDLVLMLDRCLDIQGNICSWGVDQPFDAEKWLKTKKAYLYYHLSSKEFEDFLREYLRDNGNEVVPIDFEKIEAAEEEYLSRIAGDKKRAAH